MAISPRLAISSFWKGILVPSEARRSPCARIEHDTQRFSQRIECQRHYRGGKPRIGLRSGAIHPALRNWNLREITRATSGKCPDGLAAIQLHLEPVLQASRKRLPGALQTGHLPGRGPVHATQFVLDRRKIDAHTATFADHDAPIDDDVTHHRCIAAREQEFERIDRHDLIAIQTIEIDGDKISWCAGQKLSCPRRTCCPATITDSKAEKLRVRP